MAPSCFTTSCRRQFRWKVSRSRDITANVSRKQVSTQSLEKIEKDCSFKDVNEEDYLLCRRNWGEYPVLNVKLAIDRTM